MKKVNKWVLIVSILIVTAGALISFKLLNYRGLPNKIILIPKSISPEFEFWQTVRMGAELAAKEENVQIETRGPLLERNIESQKEILKEAINEQADIILLAATNVDALKDLVEEAKLQGITVLTVDSTVEGVQNITNVATDSIQASAVLTKYLIERLGQQGEIIMINFVEGASTANERDLGYKQEASKYKDIIMHPTVYTEGTTSDAYRATKQILKDYPNLKGIVAANQQVTDAVCDAVQEMDLQGKVKVVGFDSSRNIIYALEKNVIDAIVVQKPFNMGYLAVKHAIQAYRGKKIASYLDTGYKLINKETLYATENQKLLYPIIK
ncbi:substrate-binding domain-containing protein [Cellulosilyticum sp. I15G10I2]|uniref:substrate-binding domain-containing protein n=1 Tax=Cellulosilyticum sp. I15G10I2 TaxID=1892843 RepID=UPI00085C221E|nr:substrate-binding domain-containing protein [Cellulosilyticum sp. I15G10I2]